MIKVDQEKNNGNNDGIREETHNKLQRTENSKDDFKKPEIVSYLLF